MVRICIRQILPLLRTMFTFGCQAPLFLHLLQFTFKCHLNLNISKNLWQRLWLWSQPLFFVSGYWGPKHMRQGMQRELCSEDPKWKHLPCLFLFLLASKFWRYSRPGWNRSPLINLLLLLPKDKSNSLKKKAFLVRLAMASSGLRWMPGLPHLLFLVDLHPLKLLCLGFKALP